MKMYKGRRINIAYLSSTHNTLEKAEKFLRSCNYYLWSWEPTSGGDSSGKYKVEYCSLPKPDFKGLEEELYY